MTPEDFEGRATDLLFMVSGHGDDDSVADVIAEIRRWLLCRPHFEPPVGSRDEAFALLNRLLRDDELTAGELRAAIRQSLHRIAA